MKHNAESLYQAAQRTLWSVGDLAHIYDTYKEQQEMIDFLDAAPEKSINYIECVRGFRKTSGLSYWLLRQLYKRPIRVMYACAIKDQVENLADMFIEPLLDDCPAELRPRRLRSKYLYEFTNGSLLRLIGLDKDKLRTRRGDQYDIAFLDEIATISDCYDMIMSVLYPMIERRNGIIVCATTPATSIGHESMMIKAKCQTNDRYFRRDVYQSQIYTQDRIASIKKELGEESTSWRAEYCLIEETDKERQVVPEFREDTHVVTNYNRPASCDFYTAMDLGLIDYTHVLFCFYDFDAAMLVVEDEICVNYQTTATIADLIKAKEREYYVKPIRRTINHKVVEEIVFQTPRKRVSDNEMQQLVDLGVTYKIQFNPVRKNYDKEVALNDMRKRFAQNKIRINKRCKNLIYQLKVGIWNERRTDYERIKGAGHLDGIDALFYLCLNVDYNHNPHVTQFDSETQFVHPLDRPKNRYDEVFGPKF